MNTTRRGMIGVMVGALCAGAMLAAMPAMAEAKKLDRPTGYIVFDKAIERGSFVTVSYFNMLDDGRVSVVVRDAQTGIEQFAASGLPVLIAGPLHFNGLSAEDILAAVDKHNDYIAKDKKHPRSPPLTASEIRLREAVVSATLVSYGDWQHVRTA